MVYVYAATEKEFQAGLIDGVVHYPGTALPGEFGNCYIFGHSSDYIWSKGKYKTIFATLPKMQLGETILVSGPENTEFIYTVIDSKKVSAKDVSVLSQQGYSRKLLTLQASYPVGTALARWVVVAEMKQGLRTAAFRTGEARSLKAAFGQLLRYFAAGFVVVDTLRLQTSSQNASHLAKCVSPILSYEYPNKNTVQILLQIREKFSA